jgi:hypothetical protein
MTDDPASPCSEWRHNYFNYFTEVEEHFQRARGTGLFLLSPLDWALIEDWKNSGVPLEAALRGIDAAFEKWRARKQKHQLVNSLAFCSQAVLQEAQGMADRRPSPSAEESAPFPLESLKAHLSHAIAALSALDGFTEIAASLQAILDQAESHFASLQELDLRLTALEEKMAAIARTRLSDDQLFSMRKAMDAQLRPYRSKMTTDQLQRLERSMMDRRIYEDLGLPRLSIFYIT